VSKYYTLLLIFTTIQSEAQYDPQKELGELFVNVQTAPVFPDSKTFVDAVPRFSSGVILKKYNQEKTATGFNLRAFVEQNFIIPASPAYTNSSAFPAIEKHIDDLWDKLVRHDRPASGSLVTLPYPYIVPGGRFNEMYYWDSYFTMLGLKVAHREGLIRNMVDNFAYLIKTYGMVPTGTRSYYLSRSQAPFFSKMVELLAGVQGDTVYRRYLPSLQKEYNFWMDGADRLTDKSQADKRVVLLGKKMILNRYWDNENTPRPEAYKEDLATASLVPNVNPEITYRHIRAAGESGWDFSSRWLLDGLTMSSIHSTDIIPVDLNCLLYHLELTLAKTYALKSEKMLGEQYSKKAELRRKAIIEYCWDSTRNFFVDYDFTRKKSTGIYSMAGIFPLFFRVADQHQADQVAIFLERYFLYPGGLVTSALSTHQQWDAPNGWAPMQWMSYESLKHFGHSDLATKVRERWMNSIRNEYGRSGKLLEKYNVLYPDAPGDGGEYPSQDGYGWTNGVFLQMLNEQ
jgi:alpha,alpha-trehalase